MKNSIIARGQSRGWAALLLRLPQMGGGSCACTAAVGSTLVQGHVLITLAVQCESKFLFPHVVVHDAVPYVYVRSELFPNTSRALPNFLRLYQPWQLLSGSRKKEVQFSCNTTNRLSACPSMMLWFWLSVWFFAADDEHAGTGSGCLWEHRRTRRRHGGLHQRTPGKRARSLLRHRSGVFSKPASCTFYAGIVHVRLKSSELKAFPTLALSLKPASCELLWQSNRSIFKSNE